MSLISGSDFGDFGDAFSIFSGVAELGSSIANYAREKENLDYQKDLQKQIFNREDNSILRRVEDLRNAGLSPILSAGSGANAGAVVNTNAAKMDNDFNLLSKIQTAQAVKNMKLQNEQNEEDLKQSKLLFKDKQTYNSLQNALLISQINKINAEFDFILANTDDKELKNKITSYKEKYKEWDFWLDQVKKGSGILNNITKTFGGIGALFAL